MRCSAAVWEQYNFARERLQNQLAHRLRSQMATLVGNMDSADLLLVAADGKKLPAHECILRARAPGFYQRHIEPTVSAMGPATSGKIREVAVGDIDSSGLEFFIHSVYTEDEIAQFPPDVEETADEDRRDADSRNSNPSFSMDQSTDLEDFKAQDRDEHILPKGDDPTPSTNKGSQNQHKQHQQQISNIPMMTSFRDLATHSPMNTSLYSIGNRSDVGPDIPEEDEDGTAAPVRRRSSRQETTMGKFIRLDSVEALENDRLELERKRSSGVHKAIFPMFIGLDERTTPSERMYQSVPEGVRGRAMIAKRLSVASLSSLTSIDVTPNHDGAAPVADSTPSCKLAADLHQMYIDNRDSDVVIKCENGELFAHKCIISATCPFFRQQLQKSRKIELKGYTKNSVHFLLSFLYGGLTTIPDEVDVWEVLALATHLNLKDLVDVVIMHLKVNKCHWFHRPCASCVSAILDALPQFYSIRSLKPLYEEALQWQAKYFARIWKGRVFMHLNERWLKECFEGVIQQIDDETLIETILGCERLQVAFSRSRTDAAFTVLNMVNDILDVSMQYLIHSFHLVITSKSFAAQGKGLALNLGILEDILPTLVHSLSADVAIKSYLGLGDLLVEIQSVPPSPKRTLSIPIDEWSSRFYVLVRRLYELVDKHLLHYAASVVRAEAWKLLNERDQVRIRETGIFVEMRQPKAAMPRFSSNNRAYKRSSSAGVQMGTVFTPERGRSIERPKPLQMIQQKARSPSSEPMEDEKPQPEPDPTPSLPRAAKGTIASENRQHSPRKDVRKSKTEEKREKKPSIERTQSPSSIQTPARPSSRSVSRETTPRAPKEAVGSSSKIVKRESSERKTPDPPKIGEKVEEGKRVEVKREKEKVKEEKVMRRKEASPVPKETAKEESKEERKEALKETAKEVPKETSKEEPKEALKDPPKPLPLREQKSRSPTKKRSDLEEHKMERQMTHTIIQGDFSRAANLPGPSPKKESGEKPKSVVKPMPKDPPLAGVVASTSMGRTPSSATLGHRKSGGTTTTSSTTKSNVPRSGIPQPAKTKSSTATASPSSGKATTTTKTTSSAETKRGTSPRSRNSPRSPNTRPKNMHNIDK
ncbi:unnamed protein product, partial [Mesorhabditis belari]|uniref:BTB domain-containing protein n=1 Tax=Mesorhabditis belari TaxID=2138241 RepID=A0AAF3EK69_9BILA